MTQPPELPSSTIHGVSQREVQRVIEKDINPAENFFQAMDRGANRAFRRAEARRRVLEARRQSGVGQMAGGELATHAAQLQTDLDTARDAVAKATDPRAKKAAEVRLKLLEAQQEAARNREGELKQEGRIASGDAKEGKDFTVLSRDAKGPEGKLAAQMQDAVKVFWQARLKAQATRLTDATAGDAALKAAEDALKEQLTRVAGSGDALKLLGKYGVSPEQLVDRVTVDAKKYAEAEEDANRQAQVDATQRSANVDTELAKYRLTLTTPHDELGVGKLYDAQGRSRVNRLLQAWGRVGQAARIGLGVAVTVGTIAGAATVGLPATGVIVGGAALFYAGFRAVDSYRNARERFATVDMKLAEGRGGEIAGSYLDAAGRQIKGAFTSGPIFLRPLAVMGLVNVGGYEQMRQHGAARALRFRTSGEALVGGKDKATYKGKGSRDEKAWTWDAKGKRLVQEDRRSVQTVIDDFRTKGDPESTQRAVAYREELRLRLARGPRLIRGDQEPVRKALADLDAALHAKGIVDDTGALSGYDDVTKAVEGQLRRDRVTMAWAMARRVGGQTVYDTVVSAVGTFGVIKIASSVLGGLTHHESLSTAFTDSLANTEPGKAVTTTATDGHSMLGQLWDRVTGHGKSGGSGAPTPPPPGGPNGGAPTPTGIHDESQTAQHLLATQQAESQQGQGGYSGLDESTVAQHLLASQKAAEAAQRPFDESTVAQHLLESQQQQGHGYVPASEVQSTQGYDLPNQNPGFDESTVAQHILANQPQQHIPASEVQMTQGYDLPNQNPGFDESVVAQHLLEAQKALGAQQGQGGYSGLDESIVAQHLLEAQKALDAAQQHGYTGLDESTVAQHLLEAQKALEAHQGGGQNGFDESTVAQHLLAAQKAIEAAQQHHSGAGGTTSGTEGYDQWLSAHSSGDHINVVVHDNGTPYPDGRELEFTAQMHNGHIELHIPPGLPEKGDGQGAIMFNVQTPDGHIEHIIAYTDHNGTLSLDPNDTTHPIEVLINGHAQTMTQHELASALIDQQKLNAEFPKNGWITTDDGAYHSQVFAFHGTIQAGSVDAHGNSITFHDYATIHATGHAPQAVSIPGAPQGPEIGGFQFSGHVELGHTSYDIAKLPEGYTVVNINDHSYLAHVWVDPQGGVHEDLVGEFIQGSQNGHTVLELQGLDPEKGGRFLDSDSPAFEPNGHMIGVDPKAGLTQDQINALHPHTGGGSATHSETSGVLQTAENILNEPVAWWGVGATSFAVGAAVGIRDARNNRYPWTGPAYGIGAGATGAVAAVGFVGHLAALPAALLFSPGYAAGQLLVRAVRLVRGRGTAAPTTPATTPPGAPGAPTPPTPTPTPTPVTPAPGAPGAPTPPTPGAPAPVARPAVAAAAVRPIQQALNPGVVGGLGAGRQRMDATAYPAIASRMHITDPAEQNMQGVAGQLFREGVTQDQARAAREAAVNWAEQERQAHRTPTPDQIADRFMTELYAARVTGTVNNKGIVPDPELESALRIFGVTPTGKADTDRAALVKELIDRKIDPATLYDTLMNRNAVTATTTAEALHPVFMDMALGKIPTSVDLADIAKRAEVAVTAATAGSPTRAEAQHDLQAMLLSEGFKVKEVEDLLSGEIAQVKNGTQRPNIAAEHLGEQIQHARMTKVLTTQELNPADLDFMKDKLSAGSSDLSAIATAAIAKGIKIDAMQRFMGGLSGVPKGQRGKELMRRVRPDTMKAAVETLDPKVLAELATHAGGVTAKPGDADYVDQIAAGLGAKGYTVDVVNTAVNAAQDIADNRGWALQDHPDLVTGELKVPEVVAAMKGMAATVDVGELAQGFGGSVPKTAEGVAKAALEQGLTAKDVEDAVKGAKTAEDVLAKLAEKRVVYAIDTLAKVTGTDLSNLGKKFGVTSGKTADIAKAMLVRGLTPTDIYTAATAASKAAAKRSASNATATEFMTPALTEKYLASVLENKLSSEADVKAVAKALNIPDADVATLRGKIQEQLRGTDPNTVWVELSKSGINPEDVVQLLQLDAVLGRIIPPKVDWQKVGEGAGLVDKTGKTLVPALAPAAKPPVTEEDQRRFIAEALVAEGVEADVLEQRLKTAVNPVKKNTVDAGQKAGEAMKIIRFEDRIAKISDAGTLSLLAGALGASATKESIAEKAAGAGLTIDDVDRLTKTAPLDIPPTVYGMRIHHTLDTQFARLKIKTADINTFAADCGISGTFADTEALAQAIVAKVPTASAQTLVPHIISVLATSGTSADAAKAIKGSLP